MWPPEMNQAPSLDAAAPSPATPPSRAGRVRAGWSVRAPLVRRRLPWVLVAGMAVYVFAQHFALGWVWSDSVDASVVIVLKGVPVARGDLMVYAYAGAPIGGWKRGDAMVKYAGAVEGETVEQRGRRFYVHGRDLGLAKTHSKLGVPLEAAQPGIVPKGYLWAYAPHPDALDSRYALAGLVPREAILGKAFKLF